MSTKLHHRIAKPTTTKTARLLRQAIAVSALLGMGMSSGINLAHAQAGRGLSMPDAPATWPHWEQRLGLVVAGADPVRNAFSLSQGDASGLKIQSAHILSDYYFSGGFRATAGLVRGATNLPWWSAPSTEWSGSTSLNLSMQRIDLLGLNGSGPGVLTAETHRTVPYVGAGYSGRLSQAAGYGAWRFNADLGLVSLNSQNIGRIGRVLQGEQGVEELLRELRLRPVVKITVNYAF